MNVNYAKGKFLAVLPLSTGALTSSHWRNTDGLMSVTKNTEYVLPTGPPEMLC